MHTHAYIPRHQKKEEKKKEFTQSSKDVVLHISYNLHSNTKQ
jgi:hypothetical protein